MTEEPIQNTSANEEAAPRRHNRSRTAYAGMWGPIEIAALGIAILALFSVVLLYLFFVAPSASALAKARSERDTLEQERNNAKNRFGELKDTQSRIAHLIQSVDDFESVYLPAEAVGKTALYQKVNALINGYGLTNTNGPTFAPLETTDSRQVNQSDEEEGRSRFRSLFPGIYATVTVEGPYQNVRRFIRDIETGNEFVIISSVEIEPSDSTFQADEQTSGDAIGGDRGAGGFPRSNSAILPDGAPTGVQGGKTRGNIVSLRLELAAYFRRAAQPSEAAR